MLKTGSKHTSNKLKFKIEYRIGSREGTFEVWASTGAEAARLLYMAFPGAIVLKMERFWGPKKIGG